MMTQLSPVRGSPVMLFLTVLLLLSFFPSNTRIVSEVTVTSPRPSLTTRGTDRGNLRNHTVVNSLAATENLWTHLAFNVLNRTSFCVREGTSPSEILQQNLVGLGTSFKSFTRITNQNISSLPVAKRPVSHPMPLLLTIYDDCVCISCNQTKRHNCSSITSVDYSTDVSMPQGWSLLCGNMSFSIIPKSYTGLCSVGRVVSLLISPVTASTRSIRSRRSLSPDCDDSLTLYTITSTVFKALFFPGAVVSTQEQTEIDELACILEKTANATAKALSYLNEEINEVRTGVLQNRAAIDYLLLKNQIGCEKLPGMCCFNLTDNSNLVEREIDKLHEEVSKIHLSSNVFLGNWEKFSAHWEWYSWVSPFLSIIGIIVLLLLFGPCILKCFTRFVLSRIQQGAEAFQAPLVTSTTYYRGPLDRPPEEYPTAAFELRPLSAGSS